jgi:hypothetical protein
MGSTRFIIDTDNNAIGVGRCAASQDTVRRNHFGIFATLANLSTAPKLS